MEVLMLITFFLVKHFICDFPLQVERHLKKFSSDKKEQSLALRDHSMIHGIGTLAVASSSVIWIGDFPKALFVFMVLVAAFSDVIIHYMIDLWKVEASRGLTPSDRKFWMLLGLDQMYHSLTYVAITGWIFLTLNYGVL